MPETPYPRAQQAIGLIAKVHRLMRLRVVPLILFAAGTAAQAAPTLLPGVVVRVVDGDTVWIRPATGGDVVKVRIDGIDAPEICQAGGTESRQLLQRRVLHQQVTVTLRSHDDYGRAIGTVDLQGVDLGRWMVGNGQAWSYRYRRDAGPYAAEENQARAAGLGIFRQKNAENPRTFRERNGSCYPSHRR